MIKKTLLSAIFLSSLSSFAHADFFIPSVESSLDRGLVVEIVLACKGRMTGKRTNSIMTLDKTTKQFCTAKKKCYGTARSAAIESCNSDEVMLSNLK